MHNVNMPTRINDRGELTTHAMSRGGTYSYAYDNIGNREMSREGTAVPTAYETNELNQYISIGEGEQAVFVPQRDAAGNQTKIRTDTGEWDVAYNTLNQAETTAKLTSGIPLRLQRKASGVIRL